MRVLRRHVLGGLTALSGAALTACLPGGQEYSSPPSAALPPARVEGWTHLGSQTDKDMLKALSERYAQTQPRITAEWVHVPPGSWVGLMEKLTPALAAGTPPDITYMSAGRVDTLRRMGQVLELDPLLTRSKDLREERQRLWDGFGAYAGWGVDIDAYARLRSTETAVVVLEPREPREPGA